MTEKKQQIIKLWNKVIVTKHHMSYSEIATQVGTGKSYVFKVIKAYLSQKGKVNVPRK